MLALQLMHAMCIGLGLCTLIGQPMPFFEQHHFSGVCRTLVRNQRLRKNELPVVLQSSSGTQHYESIFWGTSLRAVSYN